LDKVKETVSWWARNDPGKPPEPSKLDDLSKTFATLVPLMYGLLEAGKTAIENGHMVCRELRCDRKLQAAFKWLDTHLNEGGFLN
jgi:hypothetical protein